MYQRLILLSCVLIWHLINSVCTYVCTISVSWGKDGRPFDNAERFAFDQNENSATFTIPAALSTDSGDYIVTARDERGENSWTFSLLVRIGDVSSNDVDIQQLINGVQVSGACHSLNSLK